MQWFLSCICLILVTAATASSSSSSSSTTSSISSLRHLSLGNNDQLQQQQQQQQEHQQDERSLAIYALYNLPSFAVKFTTTLTDELHQQRQEGPILADDSVSGGSTASSSSSLSYPLRTITQDVLKERFLLKLSQAALNTEDTGAEPLPDIYNHLVAVDLQTKIYFANNYEDQDEERDPSRRQLVEYVTLVAEMYGTVAFLEPHQHDNKPTNEEVRTLFGGWMTDYFTNDRDLYLRRLVDSDQEMLQQTISLVVETNIDEKSSTTTTTVIQRSDGWSSSAEKILLIVLVLLGVVAVIWIILYAHHKRMKRNMESKYSFSDDNFVVFDPDISSSLPHPMSIMRSNNNKTTTSPLDAMRHGEDSSVSNTSAFAPATPKRQQAISVLEASDRYLSKHRPDLFEASHPNGGTMQQHTNRSHQAFTPITQEDVAESHSFNVLGRDYVIPSNPFEYIYDTAAAIAFGGSNGGGGGGNVVTSPEKQPPQRPQAQRQSSFRDRMAVATNNVDMLQQENIATTTESDDIRFHVAETSTNNASTGQWMSGYTPISSIWRNLSTYMFEDGQTTGGTSHHHHHQQHQHRNDGLVCITESEDEEIIMQPLDDKELIGADPEVEFPFAFQDFPRHDGTPCLMYNEDALAIRRKSTTKDQQIFVIEDDDEDDANKDTTPVSDDAFKRMLSQQGADSSYDADDNGNTITEDCIQVKPSEEHPDFMGKLDRIVANRHRQYEKKSIVERHQAARAKERAEYRERERRERHKAMEQDIEAIEDTFSHPLDRNGGSTNKRYLVSPIRTDHTTSSYSPRKPSTYSPTRQSPVFRGGGRVSPVRTTTTKGSSIFRRSPHEGSPRLKQGSSSASTQRSVSPPGGLEDMDYDKKSSSSATRSLSRKQHHHDNDNYYDSTTRADILPMRSDGNRRDLSMPTHTNYYNDDYRIDEHTLDHLSIPDKLSMPRIGTKQPSPNSVVIDDVTAFKTPSPQYRSSKHHHHQDANRTASTTSTTASLTPDTSSSSYKPYSSHRRIHSSDDLDDILGLGGNGSSSSLGRSTIDGNRTSSSGGHGHHHHHHRRAASGNASAYTFDRALQQQQQQQQLPPYRLTPTRNNKYQHHSHHHHQLPKQTITNNGHHRRSNSQDIRRTNSHGGGSNHSRSNSTSDDVLLHGIYAQTRFV